MTDEVIGRLIIEESGGVGSVSGGRGGASSSNKDISKMSKSMERMSGVMLGADMTKFLKMGGSLVGGIGAAAGAAAGATTATTAAVAAAAALIIIKGADDMYKMVDNLDLPGAADEADVRDAVTESLEDGIVTTDELSDALDIAKDTTDDFNYAFDDLITDVKTGDINGVLENVARLFKNLVFDMVTDYTNVNTAMNIFVDSLGGSASSMSAFSNDRYQSIVSAEGQSFGYRDDYLQQSVMTSDEFSSQEVQIIPFTNPATTNVSRGSSSNDQFTQ